MEVESRDLWVAVVYSAAVGVLSLVLPIATQSLVNTISFGMLLQPLLWLAIFVFMALVFSGALYLLRMWVVEIIQRRVFVRIAQQVVDRLLRVRIDAYDRRYGPEIVNRFFEVVTVQKAGASLIVEGLTVLMELMVGLTIMSLYDPILLGFGVVLLGAIFVILFPLGSNAVRTAVKESKAKYGLVAWLEEIARNPITFKSEWAAKMAVERTDSLTGDYLVSRAKHFRIIYRQAIGAALLQAVGLASLLGVGGLLVINNRLTIGQLIASELIVSAVLSGILKFSKQLETFHDLLAAVDKLGYFDELPLEESGSERLPGSYSGGPNGDLSNGGAAIRLRNVTYSYDNGRGNTLDGVDWEIPAGSRIGLTGKTGGGKSTLLDILFGLRAPLSGALELDETDSRSVALADWRTNAALVRSPEVFDGTIAENLRLGHKDLASNDLRDGLKLAGLWEVIQVLPEGLETKLTSAGRPLSQGQMVRLMLARAIVHRPRLLLIDEALDLIEDPLECAQLVERLVDRRNPWTVVISTRRSEVLERCDGVFSLDAGKLICQSTNQPNSTRFA
jgi:ABC-type bacteriocin/lantibiotic exporter with double-glycine peptidase domain